jgi:hypothetical protein
MPRDLTKFIAPDLVNSQCTECGAQVPVKFDSCDELFTRPTKPDQRGALTIRHVYDAETKVELAARMHAWAREVWEAYASQHELARNWIKKAMGE